MMTGYYSTSTTTNYDAGTNAGTWTVWCDDNLTGSSTTTTNNTVWVQWTVDSTSTTSTTTDVWGQWGRTYVTVDSNNYHLTQRQETEEEREERERRAEERRQRLEEEQKVRDEARKRAEELLLSFLSRKQRKDWAKSGKFYLYSGKKRYRITRGRVGNVALVDEKDKVLERYCCHPVAHVPDADCALSQMLALQHNEQHFLDLANVHERAPGFNRAEYERRLAA